MPLKSLFKGDGGDGRRESGGGGNGSRSDAKLLSKAKALLQNATAPLSARVRRGVERSAMRGPGRSAGLLTPAGSRQPPPCRPGLQRERSVDRPFFNPEEHISEKREWSRRYTQSQSQQPGRAGGGGATAAGDRLFEHFAVVVSSASGNGPALPAVVAAAAVAGSACWSTRPLSHPTPPRRPAASPPCAPPQGLPPTVNIKAVAADIKTFQRVSREAGGGGRGDTAAEGGLEITADTPREGLRRQYGLKGPAHAAEVGGESTPRLWRLLQRWWAGAGTGVRQRQHTAIKTALPCSLATGPLLLPAAGHAVRPGAGPGRLLLPARRAPRAARAHAVHVGCGQGGAAGLRLRSSGARLCCGARHAALAHFSPRSAVTSALQP